MRLARAALLAIVSIAGCRARACDRGKGIVADDAPAWRAEDLVEACVEVARARCTLLDRCQPGTANWWGGLDRCAEQARRGCRLAVGATGATLTPSIHRACAEAYATQSCDDVDVPPTVCEPKGTLPRDAPCVFAMQCASGACRIKPQETCGRCIERSTRKKGEPCTVSLFDAMRARNVVHLRHVQGPARGWRGLRQHPRLPTNAPMHRRKVHAVREGRRGVQSAARRRLRADGEVRLRRVRSARSPEAPRCSVRGPPRLHRLRLHRSHVQSAR